MDIERFAQFFGEDIKASVGEDVVQLVIESTPWDAGWVADGGT